MGMVLSGSTIEVGEKKFESSGDRIDVAGLGKEGQLRIESRNEKKKWRRKGRCLDGRNGLSGLSIS